MHKVISVEAALPLPSRIFIDVRTPAEFAVGHLPQAVNIPIFSNEERARIGKLYKQVSVDEAKQQGLEFISPKLPLIIKTITDYAKDHQIIIYCWRGGMRSMSIVSILDMLGVPAFQLIGGYKAYRRHVLDSLEAFVLKPEVVVLCGSTGVGKTILLNKLAVKGIPVIDLEGLANHRGSAFGQIGLGKSTAAPLFDAAILQELENLQDQRFFVVECESKRVGNAYLPDSLYQAMQRGKRILVHASIPNRVQRLIAEYTKLQSLDIDTIQQSIQAISAKLGKKKTSLLLDCLNNNNIEQLVEILLTDYYDLLYGFEKFKPDEYDAIINADDLDQAASEITCYLEQLRRI